MKSPEMLVRRYFQMYQARDRAAFEAALRDEFTFTSPQDDHIDRAAFMERCWPNGEQQGEFHFVKSATVGDAVYVTYTFSRPDGTEVRNTELFELGQDGRISS